MIKEIISPKMMRNNMFKDLLKSMTDRQKLEDLVEECRTTEDLHLKLTTSTARSSSRSRNQSNKSFVIQTTLPQGNPQRNPQRNVRRGPQPRQQPKEECRKFKLGTCDKGKKCKFKHVQPKTGDLAWLKDA